MYQIIDGIPVWGEHEESTLGQIRRCAADELVAGAALMADGHKGYSMPIGGVVAYRDAVSPSGIGYDISCIAAGTPVSTHDGYWLPIEQVLPAHPATCWDGAQTRRIAHQQGALARPSRPTVKLTLANGRTLVATTDHLVRTRHGWRPAGELGAKDVVACATFVGLPYAPSDTDDIPLALPNQRVVDELRRRDLYPLRPNAANFATLLRLLAVVSGDGHLSADGKRVSVYTTNERDAAEIAADFERLGFRPSIGRRERAEGRKAELHVYVSSTALHALLAALGSPAGKKVWPQDPMPWLFRLPAWMRAHFLSSFCSAEMMTPRVLGNRIPNFQLKQAGENTNAISFVARLFESLDFAVSVAPSGAARGERNDYVLQILGGGAAQVRFLEEIGFCYAHEKRLRAAEVASVHWQHAAAISHRAAARDEARHLKHAGRSHREVMATVSAQYAVSEGFVYHAMYEQRGLPRLVSTCFAPDTDGEIVWVPVISNEPVAECAVYDIVTGDPAHAFFAAGVVVHNCGNKAVRTEIRVDDVRPQLSQIMDDIARTVVFGVGQTSGKARDHELFDDPTWRDVPQVGKLKQLAREQLGTVGSGNHYVDLFEDESGWLWVGVHFGSRGLGHRTASGFLNLAAGRAFDAKAPGEHMDQPATVIPLRAEMGQAYWQAMTLAGRYAYAGRDFVVGQVLGILGAQAVDEVHNHHNYAWIEQHGGEDVVVVRKGATPAWPGQRGFIGGSMGDISVIVEGVATDEARAALHSTVHGAGRVMSRTRAAGKSRWTKINGRRVQQTIKPGEISEDMMHDWLQREGVELRGGGTDESPHVYRRLPDVLATHADSIRVLHTLTPLGVAMAGDGEFDPYKD